MKQTPFYEIGMALHDRPRGFRIIVTAGLHLCFLVLLQLAVEIWLKQPEMPFVKIEKKAEDQFMSAKNAQFAFSK